MTNGAAEDGEDALVGASADDIVAAYNISFYNEDGAEQQPSEAVTVTINVPLDMTQGYELIHIADDGTRSGVDGAKFSENGVTFTADSFSVYAVVLNNNGDEAYIHWGYMNSDSFTEFDNASIDESTGTFSLRGLYEGYTYVQAYYSASELSNPTTGKMINTTISKSSEGVWQYEDTANNGALTPIAVNGHLYAVYVKDGDPAQPPVLTPPAEKPNPLNTEKTVVPNKNADGTNDGTYRITLKVTGAEQEQHQTEVTSANVLVILDRSSSMLTNMNGDAWDTVKQATKDLVDAMPVESNVDFALIQFAQSVTDSISWTRLTEANKATVKTQISNFSTPDDSMFSSDNGTNWDSALSRAKTIADARQSSGDTDPTYIIFLTDGCPSVNSQDNTWTHSHGVGGTTNPEDRCITNAYTNMKSLVDAGYKVYGIYANVTGDDTKVTTGGVTYTDPLAYITTVTGAAGYFKADNTSALNDVFRALIKDITTSLGYSNVAVNDGVTNLSDISASVSVAGAAGNFEYRRDGGNDGSGNKKYDNELWTTAPTASASGSGVTWDLSPIGNLEVGVTYSVSFDIWPSQKAYDLIANLNNGKIDYDELAKDIQDQIGGTGPNGYYLKTNTFLNTTYTFNGQSYEATNNEGDSTMALDSGIITIKKNWPQNVLDEYAAGAYNDDGTIGTVDELDLTITQDGASYITKTLKREYGWQPDPNDSNIYIACGVMTVKNGVAEIKGTAVGHDYTVTEPPKFSYYWDLIANVYHPMVINGKQTLLILDDTVTTADNTNTFKINNKFYRKTASGQNQLVNRLEASNYRRSNLNLTKVVSTAGGQDGFFTYTATVKDAYSTDGNVWFAAFKPGATGPIKSADCSDWVISGATAEDGDTGYWHATNGATVTLKIKAGWNVRFLNLYHGSTFSFEETNMPQYYAFVKAKAENKYPFMDSTLTDDDWRTVESRKVSGTIVEPNNQYTVTYTNKYEAFYIYHSGVEGDGNLEVIPMTAVDSNGKYNLYAKTTQGTLYGGYYLDYAGKGSYNDDGIKATDGVAYTGMNYDWSGAQTEVGTQMTPVAGETYYIKEVPTYYLRNYYQINYVKSTGDLTALFLVSAIDDLNYQNTGFVLTDRNQTATVVSTMTFTNDATKKTVTLKADNVFKSLGIDEEGEYLTYFDTRGSDYFRANTSYTVLPYWTTPDGILVKGISIRTITINALQKTGISKSDS